MARKSAKAWPSRFGTLGEKVFGKGDPFNEPPAGSRWARDAFSSDEIPPTRNPVDGKYYTSATKMREVYRAAGVAEVGNDWKGDPSAEVDRDGERRAQADFRERYREKRNGGPIDRDKYRSPDETIKRFIERRRD